MVLGRDLLLTHFPSARLSWVGPAGTVDRTLAPPDERGGDRSTPRGPRRWRTAPFHWSGTFESMTELMEEVSTLRMGGVRQSRARTEALASWLEGLRPVRGPRHDTAAISRGEALFEDATVGCASCHPGPMRTNGESADVGRGEALQVPSLVGVGTRAPFMHDLCAPTLLERFDPACAGNNHGAVAHLADEQLSDLAAFLLSL